MTSAYLAIAVASARTAMGNRLAFTSNLVGGLVQFGLGYLLWSAFFARAATPQTFDPAQIHSYLLIALLVNSVITGYDEWRNAHRILDGSVALDLVKPLDYQRARLAEQMGTATAELAGLLVVAGALALLLGGVAVPPLAVLAVFVVSFALGILLKAQIVCLTVVLCFGRQDYLGLHWTRNALMTLLSGTVIPISLYPDWLRDIALALPFSSILFGPFTVFVAESVTADVLGALGRQVLWAAVLWVLVSAVQRRAVRKFEAVGG